MGSSIRLGVIVTIAVPLLFSPGCQCIRTPRSIRIREEMDTKIQKDLARRKEPMKPKPPTESKESNAFDARRRMESLREYYELKRWDAVRHEGLALATAEMSDFDRLELFLVLAEAFQSLGDQDRAGEYAAKARKLYEQIRESGQLTALAKERDSLLKMIGRVTARSGTDLFADEDGEPRQNVKLAQRLKDAKPEDVLEETLPDGAQVYFSHTPESLASRLEGVDRELVHAIQRDPEFNYYYALKEPTKDARSRTGP